MLSGVSAFFVLTALLGATHLTYGAQFPDPPGGWTYKYNGDKLTFGEENSGWTSLDGTWTHDNGSDSWDGSQIGGTLTDAGGFGTKNGPGGTILGTQNGATYLRLQDTGDPRNYGFTDPCSRKIYFGHNIGSDIDPTKALTIMDDGVTLTFRARIPTLAKAGPPLDQLYRQNQQAAGPQPYPDNGDGYVTSDGGKGNFVIRQGGDGADSPAGAIAFSFTQTTDTTGGATNSPANFAGLTFNEFNGNAPTDQVNFGQGSKTNLVAFDPTDWHELYIVLRKDPARIGTHDAFIFVDGDTRAHVFKMTAGTGADMDDSFLAMGGSATPQNWALDVDWFGYKDAAVFPPGAQLPPSLFNFTPANQALFHSATNGLQFTASSQMPTNTLPASGYKVIVNGQDVSKQLTLSGTDASASRTATFTGLQPNAIYSATYIVTDSGGLSSTNDLSFDTLVASQTSMIESEDFNYAAGQFIDSAAPGAYAGQVGTSGVDYVDSTPATVGVYRDTDAVDITASTDVARKVFTDAGATDYQVAGIGQGEWWNYTRTLPAGKIFAYLRCASTSAQDVRLDRVTGNAAQPNQAVQFLGTFHVPRTGNLNTFQYIPLTDVQGQPVALPVPGRQTLRLTAVGGAENLALNYLAVVNASGPAAASPSATALPSPGAIGVLPDVTLQVAIYDGASPVSQGSVKLKVDGDEVNATVEQSNGITSVRYTPPAFWPAGSAHLVNLALSDGTLRAFDWSFTMANYVTLTPAMKVTDAQKPGFVWRMFQNEANQDTSIQKVEDALAGKLKGTDGQLLPNLSDSNVTGPASGAGAPTQPGTGTMTFTIPTVINVSQAAETTWGNFTPDEQMPGVPGTSGSTDGVAVEILTFLQLPRGLVTMGVNSDDGFQTSAGFLKDSPLVLGEVNGGRSSADTIFQFAVDEAGVYAFRTLWMEGGGDASIEWFTVKADGSKVLINNTADGGVPAFQTGTVPIRPKETSLTIKSSSGGNVIVEWSAGSLESADTVNGKYQSVPQATSPYSIAPAGTQKYYRVRIQ